MSSSAKGMHGSNKQHNMFSENISRSSQYIALSCNAIERDKFLQITNIVSQ